MPFIEQIYPSIYSIPTSRTVMYLVRAGIGNHEKYAADLDHREVVEDDRWGRLGVLFEEALSTITESARNRQKGSGDIVPKESWQPGDREWLEEQASKMGLKVRIGPLAQQAGWHSNQPWISFHWHDQYFQVLNEYAQTLPRGQFKW